METLRALFPAGLIVTERISNIDELDKIMRLDRIQISRGRFYSYLDAFFTHNVQLSLTRRSIRLAVNGDIPYDSIYFVMIVNDASIVQQKHTLTKHHLGIFEFGSEFDAVFLDPINMLNICINRDVFKKKYEQKFQEVYPVHSKSEFRLCNTEYLEPVKEVLLEILATATLQKDFLKTPENINIIEENIISYMLDLVFKSSHQYKESKQVDVAFSLFQYIQARFDEDINIDLLCKELKISRRNAYLTFQKHYKMTPKQYHISLRLGNIKKVLIHANPKTTKIDQVAMLNGFYHMSHFAKLYKSFFGELPSQTLWRNKHV